MDRYQKKGVAKWALRKFLKRNVDTRRGMSSEMEIIGVHPAVFRKSAELLVSKRVVKHSWCKERKERIRGRKERNIWLGGCDPAIFVREDSKGVTGVAVCKCGI